MAENVTFITDESDLILPEFYILSGDELRRSLVLKLRRDLLNAAGEDYFILDPKQVLYLDGAWNRYALTKYPLNTNYKIDPITGENLGPVEEIIDL